MGTRWVGGGKLSELTCVSLQATGLKNKPLKGVYEHASTPLSFSDLSRNGKRRTTRRRESRPASSKNS